MHQCEVCNAKVPELRRGRCWGCYARWVDARPVGLGARCVTCTEKRRRVLRMVELLGAWRPMCFNCAGQLPTLEPMPPSIPALALALSRERRRKDRRFGKPDSRVFRHERRVGERRTTRDEFPPIDDDMIIEVSIERVESERLESLTGSADDGMDFDDLTAIRELVHDLRPVELAG